MTKRLHITLLLALTYAFSFMDRQVLTILQEQIKAEFELSDLEIGSLHGLAFGLFYAVLALPIARLADRSNRVSIIGFSVALWSIATAACGFATSFAQLFLARICVAVGEAGGTPPAHSILSDLYRKQERAQALAIYSLGTPVGMVLGLLGGGYIGSAFGWRTAFIAVGLPGLVLALAVRMLVREPRRGEAEDGPRAAPASVGLFQSIGEMLRTTDIRHFLLPHVLAVFVGYALTSWLPSLLLRNFNLEPRQAGLVTAGMIVLSSAPGLLIGGHFADRRARRSGDLGWLARLPALSLLLALPAFLAGLWMPSLAAMVVLLGIGIFLFQMSHAPGLSLIQSSVQPSQRALAAAMAFFLANLVGLGLGPILAGLISDLAAPRLGDAGLRLGLTVTTLALLPATLAFKRAIKPASRLGTTLAPAAA